MAAFFLSFERHGWEKDVEICGKEGKASWTKVLRSLEVQKHPFFLEHGRIFSIKGKPQQARLSFLLDEHGDLYFLLHKNIVRIILQNLEKK